MVRKKEVKKLNSSMRESLNYLIDIANFVAVDLDFNSVLQRIVDRSTDFFSAQSCSIIANIEGRYIVVAATGSSRDLIGREIKPGEGIAGKVIETGKPVFSRGTSKRYKKQSFMVIPLERSGRVVGVLNITDKSDGEFSFEDFEIAQALSKYLAIFVENAKLFTEQARLYDKLELLYVTLDKLNRYILPREIFDFLIHRIREVVGAERVSVMVEEAGALKVVAASGFEPPDDYITSGISWEVFTSNKPLWIKNIEEEEFSKFARHTEEYTTKSAIVVPLETDGEVLGVLNVTNKLSGDFDEDDYNLVVAIANVSAVALHRAMLYERVERKYAEYFYLSEVVKAALHATGLEALLREWYTFLKVNAHIPHLHIVLEVTRSRALDDGDVYTLEVGDGRLEQFVSETFRNYKLVLFSPADAAFLKMLASEMVMACAAIAGEKIRYEERKVNLSVKVRNPAEEKYEIEKKVRIRKVAMAIAEDMGEDVEALIKEIDKWNKSSTGKLVYKGEKWSGGGYPYGLKAHQIPWEARVYSVAETFTSIALKDDVEKALMLVKKESGRSFDPKVVESLERLYYSGKLKEFVE